MRRRTAGNMALEAALWIPFLVLLIVGMVQFGKITYVYYTLKKTVYSAARYLSLQQGVNFCDLANDPNVTAAIQFAITGSTDGSGTPLIPTLAPDMFEVTTQCVDPASGVAGPCNTGGCPTVAQRPDYIMVSMPSGYLVQPRIPMVTLEPILLHPYVLVPFGGTT
jgi:Flp pilus assembly protein TadG